MVVKLRVMQGAQAGREVIIPGAEFVIGRGEECHLRPRSDAISRRHCAIAVGDKQVTVQDLGSKNGSFVNGQRIEGICIVSPGDQLQVGPLQFEFVIEHTLGGGKRPAARDVKEVAARTAASPNEELDIARWLEEDDDTDASRAVAGPETRQFRIDDTNQMALETSVDADTQSAPDGANGDSDDEEASSDDDSHAKKKLSDRWKKSSKGKLPPRPKQQCKDSRDAAADMLKRFFNRS